jgi:hypothetical protein
MFKTKNDIPEATRVKVVELLNAGVPRFVSFASTDVGREAGPRERSRTAPRMPRLHRRSRPCFRAALAYSPDHRPWDSAADVRVVGCRPCPG